MIAMKLAWLLFQGLLCVAFVYLGSAFALGLMVLLVLIPVCSLAVNLYACRKVQFRVEAPQNLRKNQQGSICVKIDNPTLFPLLRNVLVVEAENQLNREKKKMVQVTAVAPRKEKTITLQAGSGYCGRIRVSVSNVKLYDCFGLVGVRCKCNGVAHMTVQPDLFEMDITLLPSIAGVQDSELYSQERPGSDLTETFQIREYVPGDSPRQVHWKLSSKFDKLIVRDPSLPITQNILVFWERTGESGNQEIIDAQAEIVVSLCHSLLEQSMQFMIGWNDTDRNRCVLHTIRNTDELVAIVPRLMRATGAKEGYSGAGLLLRDGTYALCEHMVYLAEQPQSEAMDLCRFGHVTMLLSDGNALDGAAVFDAEHYAEQLAGIAL